MKNELEFGPHERLRCRLELEFCTCSSSCAHCRLAIEKKKTVINLFKTKITINVKKILIWTDPVKKS